MSAGIVADPDVYWKSAWTLAEAGRAALVANGLPIPGTTAQRPNGNVYVSSRGEVNLSTKCGCEALLVIPGVIEDANQFELNPDKCAFRHRITHTLLIGRCITEFLGKDGKPCNPPIGDPGDPCGDPFVEPPAGSNGGPTIHRESWLVSRDRWVIWNAIRECWKAELCACLGTRFCNGAKFDRQRVDPDVGGSCEWSAFTMQVTV